MQKKEDISYSQAFSELEKILQEIENEEIDLDNLSNKIKRASFLLKSCKSKLRSTEREIEGIVDEIDNED